MEKLRQAVLDKNFYWFNRYRTVDGYSIYRRPGRPEIHRRPDQPRGRPARDGNARRDDRQPRSADLGGRPGQGPQSRRHKHAPFIPVKTNKPGHGPNGAHIFLSGEEAIGR